VLKIVRFAVQARSFFAHKLIRFTFVWSNTMWQKMMCH